MESPVRIGHDKFYHGRQQASSIRSNFSRESKGIGVVNGYVFLGLIAMPAQFLSQLTIGM
jgi:hypothetical protein